MEEWFIMRDDIKMGESYVLIYDTTGRRSYALYNIRASEDNNALESYTISGGDSDPVEYIQLKVPKKKMEQVASDLMKPNAIVPGKNKIYVNAVGRGEYIVTSPMTTDGNYCIITGYLKAYRLASTTLAEDTSALPFDMIKDVMSGHYGTFITGKFKYWCIKRETPADTLFFKAGQTLWYAVQVCAMYLGCRIFFSGDDAYLVDFRLAVHPDLLSNSEFSNISYTTAEKIGANGKPTGEFYPDAVCDYDTIELYTKDSSRPEYGRCVGQVKTGNEGQTTVINKVIMSCENRTVEVNYKKAQTEYNDMEKTKKEMTLDILKESEDDADPNTEIVYRQGSIYASNLIDYRCEAQQSIQFSMKELQNLGSETHWIPFFMPSSRVRAIDDDVDDFHITNMSVLNKTIAKPQKLALSSYTRRFPEGVSTYEFGVIKTVDLSQKICDLTSAQQ